MIATSSNQPQPPQPDPLIDEVRRVRQEVEEECCGDWERLASRLRQIESQHASRLLKADPTTETRRSA